MIYLPIVGIVFCHRFGDVPGAGKATVEENLINQGFPSKGSVGENFSSHYSQYLSLHLSLFKGTSFL